METNVYVWQACRHYIYCARSRYRAEEHFLFQSTFKVLVVSAILKQSVTDAQLLQQKIGYTKQERCWST
jgi:beta-lactamase class A